MGGEGGGGWAGGGGGGGCGVINGFGTCYILNVCVLSYYLRPVVETLIILSRMKNV